MLINKIFIGFVEFAKHMQIALYIYIGVHLIVLVYEASLHMVFLSFFVFTALQLYHTGAVDYAPHHSPASRL